MTGYHLAYTLETARMPTPAAPPRVPASIGGADTAEGQIVITPDGVVHTAGPLGVMDPPIEWKADPFGMGDPALGKSQAGNPYVAPAIPPPTGLVERAREALRPRARPLSPAQLALRPGPPSTLSPRAMGQRLELLEATEDGGRAAVDRGTGARWTVRAFPTADQAGIVVAAGALYRLVGVAAPAARLVDIGDRPAVAWPHLAAWYPIDTVPGNLSPELSQELPADVWIGNSRIPDAIRARRYQIPGSATLVRWDLSGCLAYRAHNRADASFTPSDVSALGELLDLVDYASGRDHPDLLAPMAGRLTVVTEEQVRKALELGALEPERVAILSAALLARRSLVALAVARLTAPR